MKITIDIDENLSDTEIHIHTPKLTSEISELYNLIQHQSQSKRQITAYTEDSTFYVDFKDILFFETDDRSVRAHTDKKSFLVKYKLYEIENLAGNDFMRISKSTILNLNKIYGITRNVHGCSISFKDTYKNVYVSRRYYGQLRNKLEEMRSKL